MAIIIKGLDFIQDRSAGSFCAMLSTIIKLLTCLLVFVIMRFFQAVTPEPAKGKVVVRIG